ncbi:MAG TPA: SpoIID/LytB domain-containing protein [Bryobacteraceae bacterium]
MKFAVVLLIAPALFGASTDIRVQLRTSRGVQITTLPLERYVAAVLAGESGEFQSAEALKAMAVAARTYAVKMRGRHASEGFDLCDTTHCQRVELNGVTARLEQAAADTAGELLWYEGKPAFTPYTRDCGGRTEDASALWPDLGAPYLKSHADDYCTRAGTSAWQWAGDPRRIVEALRQSSLRTTAMLDRISILNRTASGRASTLVLAGGSESVRISAGALRFAVGRELGWNTIRSDRYEVRSTGGRVVFEGTGSGHGAGLCQRGAEQMGITGRSYREILAYYYPGTVTGLNAKGLSWQRLGGETMSMLTARPDQDRAALAAAERLGRALTERTQWPLPARLELRVYPDIDTFRNATGEPGWVAARTTGTRIDLQPSDVLRGHGALDSTVGHELAHVLVESQAIPGLPLWFREGLVEYLESGRGSGVARMPVDGEFRQTADAARARRAYADAAAEVAGLVQRYGEGTVLGWVTRGLPAEVTKASASQAPTKSK